MNGSKWIWLLPPSLATSDMAVADRGMIWRTDVLRGRTSARSASRMRRSVSARSFTRRRISGSSLGSNISHMPLTGVLSVEPARAPTLERCLTRIKELYYILQQISRCKYRDAASSLLAGLGVLSNVERNGNEFR